MSTENKLAERGTREQEPKGGEANGTRRQLDEKTGDVAQPARKVEGSTPSVPAPDDWTDLRRWGVNPAGGLDLSPDGYWTPWHIAAYALAAAKREIEGTSDMTTTTVEKKPVATLTIRSAGKMTPEGREAVAEWLRMHARMLLKDGANYSPRFTGHYEAHQ